MEGNKADKVFVVTYVDSGENPTVTVFDNKEAAEKCAEFFKKEHETVCLDEAQIYKKFIIYVPSEG